MQHMVSIYGMLHLTTLINVNPAQLHPDPGIYFENANLFRV